MSSMYHITSPSGKGNQQLRHEIRELVAEAEDFDLEAQITELLSGRAGFSFAEQRERAQAVVDLLAPKSDGGSLDQALAEAMELVALIDTRDKAANDPMVKAASVISGAKAALTALTAARVEAQEQETKLMNLLDQLAEIEADLVVAEGDATA